jgi:5'-3' exonuclease
MDKIVIHLPAGENNRVLFVDLSYFVFYRYYAVLGWYHRFLNGEEVAVDKLMEDETFMEKYKKLFERDLCRLMKTYSIASWDSIFLVKDCSRDTIWRNDYYAHYKSNREDKTDTFNRDIFKITYSELIPTLQTKYGFGVVCHPRLEADDVIALLCRGVLEVDHKAHIVVITNDNDYVQLEGVVLRNLQGKDLATRVGGQGAVQYLKQKIIMGDKSDNIPSIMKKVGPKTAEKLAQQEEHFDEFVKKHPEAWHQYELNRLLMDFGFIPVGLKEELCARIEYKI